MRDRLTAFARVAGSFVPDATAMAVLMIALLAGAAVALGDPVGAAVDAFYRGLWMLLAFAMQMSLVLVLSAVVSATPVFRRVVVALARVPRTRHQVIALAILVAAGLGYLYWGLAVALGPLVAVHFARAAEEKGLPIDFPCLLAAVTAAGSVWMYGLSSSPALLVATPGHFLEKTTGLMPLSSTIWSAPALLYVVAYPALLIVVVRLVMARSVQPLSAFPKAQRLALQEHQDPGATVASSATGIARWSEESRVVPLLLAGFLVVWLWHHFVTTSASLDLNSMVTILLLGAVLMTGTMSALTRGLQHGVQQAWAVIVLYNLYGGVAGLLQYTSVGARLAEAFASVTTAGTFPLLTALAGTVVALFVPSSGGQWIIQGYLTSQTAAAVGATPQLGLLSLCIGDQMGNLISPFWLVVAAAIAGIEFRTIFGYCLLFAGLWFATGVAIFTFLSG